jgi:hypothetical protein
VELHDDAPRGSWRKALPSFGPNQIKAFYPEPWHKGWLTTPKRSTTPTSITVASIKALGFYPKSPLCATPDIMILLLTPKRLPGHDLGGAIIEASLARGFPATHSSASRERIHHRGHVAPLKSWTRSSFRGYRFGVQGPRHETNEMTGLDLNSPDQDLGRHTDDTGNVVHGWPVRLTWRLHDVCLPPPCRHPDGPGRAHEAVAQIF